MTDPDKGDKLINIAELSVFISPSKDCHMAILRAYFDDSGDEDDPQILATSLCGYIGKLDNWQYFEDEWQKTLKKHDVPYLHMKEFAHFKKHFAKYKEDIAGRDSLLIDLIKVIQDSHLEGITTSVDLNDLRDFNQGNTNDELVNGYSLNLYTAMWIISNCWPKTNIEIFLDKTNDVHKKIDIATKYAKADKNYHDDGYLHIFPLNKQLSFIDILPLQAADLIAYEVRKDDTTTIKRYDGIYLWPKISDHILRKSLENLLVSTKINIKYSMIWNIIDLQLHERGGYLAINETLNGELAMRMDIK